MTTQTTPRISERIDALDWGGLADQLDERGFAITEPVLDRSECEALAALFEGDVFRSTVEMARHRFGEGRYRYFSHPLPDPIQAAREAFYERLAPIANRWADLLSGESPNFPATHDAVARALPGGGADPSDAAPAPVSSRRLERAAPGPLRGCVLPVPSADGSVRGARRLHGR